MGGLSIDTNSSGNPAFPEHPNPGDNPSEADLRLFHDTINGRSPDRDRFLHALNPLRNVLPGGSVNGLDRMVQARAYPPKLSSVAGLPQQQAVLTRTLADFKSQFTEHAQSREGFHRLLSQAFGPIDADQAEAIREWALDNDFSWLPKIELVSGDPTFRGAYSADEGTVFINQTLLDDPDETLRVLTEELGHHLETQVRTGDSPGDEGAVFARKFLGEEINPQQLAALRDENDNGIVAVDGETTHVEFNEEPPPIELPPITVIADPIDPPGFGFDPGGFGDDGFPDSGGGFGGGPTVTDIHFDGGDGVGILRLEGVDRDIVNVGLNGDKIDVVIDGRRFKLTGTLAGLIGQNTIIGLGGVKDTVELNGAKVRTEDGFELTLGHIDGTHNNMEFRVTGTPYDDLAQTTGVSWERYDQGYLDLKTRGFDDFANRLQTGGILPPLGAFEPGSEIETAWRADYDRFLQRTADTQGVPLDAVKESVNDLYTRDGINASNLLVGNLPVLNADAVNQGNVQYANRDGFAFEWKASVENLGTDQAGISLEQVFAATPYDGLAQATEISWQRYDQGYLDLKTRGFDDFANRLQSDGILPPLAAYEPGSEIETAWRADYDRFLQRTAETQGIPLDVVKESVNDLYTHDPIKASDLLLGKLTTSEAIDAYAGSVLSSDPVTFFRDVYDLAERFDDALKEGTFDYADSTVNLILSLAEWETYDNLAQFSKTLLVSLGDAPSLSVFFPPDEVAEAREQLDAMVAQVKDDFTNTWAEAQAEGKEFEQIVKWGITGGLDVATGIITGSAFAHSANKAGGLLDSFNKVVQRVDSNGTLDNQLVDAVVGVTPENADDIIDAVARGEVSPELLAELNPRELRKIARALDGENTDIPNINLPSQRPTWRQSEIDVGTSLEQQDFRPQVSFKDGVEVPYGTKGSTRPDFFKEGVSVEVKNYNVETAQDRSNLVRNVSNQAKDRAQNLPASTTQQVHLDVRGQNILLTELNQMLERIVEKSNGSLKAENINILR